MAIQHVEGWAIYPRDTNDHSPIWNVDGSQLPFAHHEFGTSLYRRLIDPFNPIDYPHWL